MGGPAGPDTQHLAPNGGGGVERHDPPEQRDLSDRNGYGIFIAVFCSREHNKRGLIGIITKIVITTTKFEGSIWQTTSATYERTNEQSSGEMPQNSPAVGSHLILALAVWVVEAHNTRRGNYYARCRRVTPPFEHHHSREWQTLPATQKEAVFPLAECRNSIARFGVVLHHGHTTREAWHECLAALRKIETVLKTRAHRLHVTHDGLIYRILSVQQVAAGREVLRIRKLRGLYDRNVNAEWQMDLDSPVERREFEETWLGINGADTNEQEVGQGEMELAHTDTHTDTHTRTHTRTHTGQYHRGKHLR